MNDQLETLYSEIPQAFVLITALAWFNDGKLDEEELKDLLTMLRRFSGGEGLDSELQCKRWLVEVLQALNATRIQLLEGSEPKRNWRVPQQYMRADDALDITTLIAKQIASISDRNSLAELYEIAHGFSLKHGESKVSKYLLKNLRKVWQL